MRRSWEYIKTKKNRVRKPLAVGCFSGSTNVVGVDRLKALHVSNLKPGTTAEDFQEFLLTKFSSAKCEILNSKYPDSYSSFKVLIPTSEYKKALDGENWPDKANVRQFFQPKKINQPPN